MRRDEDLRRRLKQYALRIITMYKALPKNDCVADVLGKQILRSGTSVGAQHREASRARSNAEFVSKMNSALQELDETGYWLELIEESSLFPATQLKPLADETNELTAIFVTIINKVKEKL